jgi:hypothetical protein
MAILCWAAKNSLRGTQPTSFLIGQYLKWSLRESEIVFFEQKNNILSALNFFHGHQNPGSGLDWDLDRYQYLAQSAGS